MKVLVATTNQDKFGIVKRMVESLVPDARLFSLAEADVPGDVVEVGTMSQRAVQKAEYFVERLKKSERLTEFDAVLAIDDGLSISRVEAQPHSQELTDRILKSEWPVGTRVDVVRAFALIKRGETARVEVTTVPFRFVGNTSGIVREKGKYPLSYVLAPDGQTAPVAHLSVADEDSFNLKYSVEVLLRLFA
jgi:hypothetical protein